MDEIIGSNAVSFCTQCGSANPASARFCDSCGTPRAQLAQPAPEQMQLPIPMQMRSPAYVKTSSASRWIKLGAGIAVALVAVAVIIRLVEPPTGTRVAIGFRDEVYYSGSATEQDAVNLGMAMKGAGYYTDRGVSTLLARDNNGFTVSFVVKDGLWDDPKYVSGYQQLLRGISPAIGGLPIKMRLVDKNRRTKEEVFVQ